jgi:hypothetical protein
MNSQDKVVAFVEGSMSPKDFLGSLTTDKDLEKYLVDSPVIPPYSTTEGDLYYYLLGLDLNDLNNAVDAKDALSQLLEAKGVAHTTDESGSEFSSLLAKVAPKWLDIHGDYASHLQHQIGKKSGKEAEAWLKEYLVKEFRFVSKPPKWLQTAIWPMNGNHPLVFVGQLDTSRLRHDDSQVYVFFDHQSGTFTTIAQSA